MKKSFFIILLISLFSSFGFALECNSLISHIWEGDLDNSFLNFSLIMTDVNAAKVSFTRHNWLQPTESLMLDFCEKNADGTLKVQFSNHSTDVKSELKGQINSKEFIVEDFFYSYPSEGIDLRGGKGTLYSFG